MILYISAWIFILIAIAKIRFDNFTFFEGSLGAGKTSVISFFIWIEYNKRKINNAIRKPISIFCFIIPILNIYCIYLAIKRKELLIRKRGTTIYTNYPYYINKKQGFSRVVDINLFNWLYKYNEDCIIGLDELGWFYPPTTNEKGAVKMTNDTEKFGITFLRHAISPCCFCSSQSIDEINITFRRKISHIYRLMNCKKSLNPFMSKVDYIEIQRSEEFGSITSINEENIKKLNYKYLNSHFKSRYAMKLYQNDIKAISYHDLLKKLDLKAGMQWKSLYY